VFADLLALLDTLPPALPGSIAPVGKTPWLLIGGGVIVVGATAAFFLLRKPKPVTANKRRGSRWTVTRGRGRELVIKHGGRVFDHVKVFTDGSVMYNARSDMPIKESRAGHVPAGVRARVRALAARMSK
jgi:hypothetical protein